VPAEQLKQLKASQKLKTQNGLKSIKRERSASPLSISQKAPTPTRTFKKSKSDLTQSSRSVERNEKYFASVIVSTEQLLLLDKVTDSWRQSTNDTATCMKFSVVEKSQRSQKSQQSTDETLKKKKDQLKSMLTSEARTRQTTFVQLAQKTMETKRQDEINQIRKSVLT
jgi:hypothetical protein